MIDTSGAMTDTSVRFFRKNYRKIKFYEKVIEI